MKIKTTVKAGTIAPPIKPCPNHNCIGPVVYGWP